MGELGVAVADQTKTTRAAQHQAARFGPLHVIAALAGALTVWGSVGPLDDYDSFFHLQLGGQILSGHHIGGLSAEWLGVDQPSGWITSQWLAEVIMHAVVAGVGWHALLALRVLVAAALVFAISVTLLRGRPAPVAVPVFLLTLANVEGMLLIRPQSAGLLFLVGLGPICVRLWTTGRRPPIAMIALASLLWAQLHGTWILAPAAFLLVAVGLQLDAGHRPTPQLRAPLLCFVASLSGVVNPHGLASFILPLRFSRASSTINEWLPTTLDNGFTRGWVLVVLATVVVWARSNVPVPRVEVLWVLAWTGFGMISYRNVTPALLMTAPATVHALTRWYEQRRAPTPSIPEPARASAAVEARAGSRESQLLALAAALLLIGSTVGALIRVPGVDVFATTPGRRIAAWVAEQPAPVRVFNDWNASGALIGLSNGKARLVIDNRTDLWGDAYTTRIDHAEKMEPGWEQTVADFRPDVVVIPRVSALVSGLTLKGWRVALTDGDLVLLLPSSAGGVAN